MQHKLKWAPTTVCDVEEPKPRKVIHVPTGDRSYDHYEHDMRLAHPEYMSQQEMKGGRR